MHTRESEQKTKWLDQNPTKNRNNIFKNHQALKNKKMIASIENKKREREEGDQKPILCHHVILIHYALFSKQIQYC